MNIGDFSFHDSTIHNVIEDPHQTLNFYLDFPIEGKNDIYEKRILRFNGVVGYQIDEILTFYKITISQIVILDRVQKHVGTPFEGTYQKIEIQTTAGNRQIEFSNCEFLLRE